MTLDRLSLYSIVLTLVAIVFIRAGGFPDGPIFWHLLAVHDMPAAWLMLAVLVLGFWYGYRGKGDASWVEQLLLALDRRRHAVALGLWLALCGGSLWVYRNHPLSMDEYAAVFQAKIFAAGALHGEFPAGLIDQLIPPDFQNNFLMVNRSTGAVFSAYWPGFSLLLAPFVWLGIPWACNPTIVAASFLLIGRVSRDLIDSPYAAGWALLFALASPAFLANGISYYSMPAHLLFNLAFAWLLLAPTPMRLFLAGLAGGFALVLHNPFPHAAFALPWIVWLAARRGQFLRNMGLLLAGYLPVVLLLGAGWWAWRQQVLAGTAQSAAVVQAAALAAPDFLERVQNLLRIFIDFLRWPDGWIVYARLGGLVKLWLWASPMLLLLALWGGRCEKTPGIRLLGASALLTFFAYFLVQFDQGHGWGYRYFHSAWGVLPVLAALGVIKLSAEGPRVFRQVAMMALLSLVAFDAQRFVQMGGFMQAHLAQFPPRAEAGRSIVLHNGNGYYARDLIQNDPWLRDDQIVLLVRNSADREAVLKHYPTLREAARNRYGATAVEGGAE